jgi:hypothetical protein
MTLTLVSAPLVWSLSVPPLGVPPFGSPPPFLAFSKIEAGCGL